MINLFQLSSFAEAKDWAIVSLVGLVGLLLGAAWGDLRGRIRTIESRLNSKIEEDKIGYERLTRCEERLNALRDHHREPPDGVGKGT